LLIRFIRSTFASLLGFYVSLIWL